MAITIATGLTRNMTEYEATSTTSLTTVPATKTFTITTGKAWQVGDAILLTPVGTKLPTRMRLSVSAHNRDTGAVTATQGTLQFEADVPSTTSMNVATGTQTLVTSPGLSLVATDPIIIYRLGVTNVYMRGTVTTYNATTGDLVANITSITGTGTAQTDWGIASDVTVANWIVSPVDNDTITLQGNAILNITQTPLAKLGNITALVRGQVIVRNSSTTTPLVLTFSKFTYAGSGINIAALGKLDILGDWIQLGVGNNTLNQLFSIPAVIDRPTLIEVETGVGTGIYKPWISGVSDRGTNEHWVLMQQPSDFQLGTDLANVFLFNATTQQVASVNAIPTGCRVRIPNIHITHETLITYLSADITAVQTTATLNYVGTHSAAVASFQIATERVTSSTRTANAYSALVRAVWSSMSPTLPLDGVKSSDSRTIAATGSFSFTINKNLSIAAGDAVRAYYQYNSANFMLGTVTSYNPTTGALVMNTTSAGTVATVSAWVFQFGKAWTKGTKVYLFQNPTSTTYSKYLALDNGGTALLENLSAHNFFLRGANYAKAELRHIGSTHQAWVNAPVGLYARSVAITSPAYAGAIGGFQLSSLAGDVDLEDIYCFSSGEGTVTNAQFQVAYCFNITRLKNINSFVAKSVAQIYNLYLLACSPKTPDLYFDDLTCVGGYLYVSNSQGIKINRPRFGDRTSGIDVPAAFAYASNAVSLANSQNITILNASKLGSSYRSQFANIDVACKNVYIYSPVFDANNNMGGVLSNSGTNTYLYNGQWGNTRGSSTNAGTDFLFNQATGNGTFCRNNRFQTPVPYITGNGSGYTTGAVIDGVTGLSMSWTTSNNMVPNYKDTGPFYTLWDDETATAGRIAIGSFADQLNNDMYTLSGSYLDTAGRLYMETAGDFAIFKTTEPIKSVTSFKNEEPLFEHNNSIDSAGGVFRFTVGAAGSGFVANNFYNVTGGSGTGGKVRVTGTTIANTSAVFASGTGYQVGDVLTVTGGTTNATITLTAVATLEYRVALPSEDITVKPFVAMTGASLSTALAGLTGYDSNVGFNMHVKMTAQTTVVGNFLVNIRMPTNNDTNYKVDDAYIAVTNVNPTDTVELRKQSDDSLIKSWLGSTTPKTFFATNKVGQLAYLVRKNGATTLKQSANFTLDVNSNGTVDLKESFITVSGVLPTETCEMRLNGDDSLKATRTGSGQFTVADVDVGLVVYFVRLSGTQIIASTKLTPKTLTTGDNGTVKLFAGDEVQIAQNSDIAEIKASINSKLDVAVSTRASASNLTIVNEGVKKASLLIPHTTNLPA